MFLKFQIKQYMGRDVTLVEMERAYTYHFTLPRDCLGILSKA